MHPAHIVISALNAICGAIVLEMVLHGKDALTASIAPFAVVGGYLGNLIAIAIAGVLLILLVVRAPAGRARVTFERQWLGLFNGAFVVAFWSWVFLA
jgi:hypothetical protein